jgi:hypothetical protein
MERETWDLASVRQDHRNLKTHGIPKGCLGVLANGGELLLTDIAEIVSDQPRTNAAAYCGSRSMLGATSSKTMAHNALRAVTINAALCPLTARLRPSCGNSSKMKHPFRKAPLKEKLAHPHEG